MMVGGAPFSINMPLSQCVVPPGVNGPVALWITSDDDPLINNVVDRATTQQIAGPALFFVDSSPEMLGQLVRGSSGSSSSSSSSSSDSSSSGTDSGASSTQTNASSSSSTDGSNGAAAPPAVATPLPLDYTGPSPDGHVNVNGVSSVAGTPAVASTAAASPSASSS